MSSFCWLVKTYTAEDFVSIRYADPHFYRLVGSYLVMISSKTLEEAAG